MMCQAISGKREAIKMVTMLLSHSVVDRIQRRAQWPKPFYHPLLLCVDGTMNMRGYHSYDGGIYQRLRDNLKEVYSEWAWPVEETPFKALPKRLKAWEGLWRGPHSKNLRLASRSRVVLKQIANTWGLQFYGCKEMQFSKKKQRKLRNLQMQMQPADTLPSALWDWAESSDSWLGNCEIRTFCFLTC